MTIEIQQVHYSYPGGIEALRDVSAVISSGESVALVGENGAGKTTLAKIVNGLLRPSRGKVIIGGEDTRESSVAQLARVVGFAFQNPDDQLFERTVQKEVAFGPRNLRLTEDQVQERVERALTKVGLQDCAALHPYDLDVSLRKLVALAATLAMETPVTVLDEPTAGQDSRIRARIGGIIDELKASSHTVIVISHDLDFCLEHMDRTIAMRGGRVLGDGTTTEILSDHALLDQIGVEPPQLIRLGHELGMRTAIRSVNEFVEMYAQQRGKDSSRP